MLIRPQVIRPRPENSRPRPRPRTFRTAQGQAKAKATLLAATVLNQIKTSDVTYCRASQYCYLVTGNFIMSRKLNL